MILFLLSVNYTGSSEEGLVKSTQWAQSIQSTIYANIGYLSFKILAHFHGSYTPLVKIILSTLIFKPPIIKFVYFTLGKYYLTVYFCTKIFKILNIH